MILPVSHAVVDGVGTFEVTRVYFSPPMTGPGGTPAATPEFDLGHGVNKVGGETIEEIELDTHEGLTIRCTGGLRILIPFSRVQATYRV